MSFVNKNKRGFTLIEVLISIAIFIIILTLVVVNHRHGENASTFRLQAFNIEDLIYSVRNMALTGQKIQDTIPSNGYGLNINIEDDSYTVFGDKKHEIEENEGILDDDDLIYSIGNLPDKISFSDIICDDVNLFEDLEEYFNIVFIPPKPLITINNTDYSSCNINLISDNVDGTWIVNIDRETGRVWIVWMEFQE